MEAKTVKVKKMTIPELLYVRDDLNQVIAVQESDALQDIPTPKLGQYWDDLMDVVRELKARRAFLTLTSYDPASPVLVALVPEPSEVSG